MIPASSYAVRLYHCRARQAIPLTKRLLARLSSLSAVNIFLIWSAINPETKTFTEPAVAIRNEIAEVSANKTLSADEKKEMLKELNEALNSVQPIRFPRTSS